MKLTFIILAAAFALPALATQDHTCQGGHNCNTTGGSTATATGGSASATATGGTHIQTNTQNVTNVVAPVTNNTNVNGQGQGQDQKQGQAQKQGQSQSTSTSTSTSQSQSADNKGNAQSTTLTFNEVKQAPAVAAPAMNTTASCRVGVGFGVSFPGGAVSGGSAYLDENCDAREKGRMLIESARIASSMGAPTEFTAPLFAEGLQLIRGAGKAEEKSAGKPTPTPLLAPVSLNP